MKGNGRIAVFGPSPMLSVTIEARGEGRDDIHCHPAGQGVWLSRMAGEMGAWPVLCSLIGGETGVVLEPLLEELPGERRLVRTECSSGCYITDRRSGERVPIAQAYVEAPSRHECDDLVAATTAAALECDLLAICNPFPGDTVPLEAYGDLVANVRAAGIPVIADLSTPRLDHVLAYEPDLVKLNDWELAVVRPRPGRQASSRLLGAASGCATRRPTNVVVTRGEQPALVLPGDDPCELIPPVRGRLS